MIAFGVEFLLRTAAIAAPSEMAGFNGWVALFLAMATLTGAVGGPASGIYIAHRRSKGIDKTTERELDAKIRRMEDLHDARRTKRVLRLERYVDEDIDYHRQIAALLREAQDAGFLPKTPIPEPPKLPTLDDLEDLEI